MTSAKRYRSIRGERLPGSARRPRVDRVHGERAEDLAQLLGVGGAH